MYISQIAVFTYSTYGRKEMCKFLVGNEKKTLDELLAMGSLV